MRRRETRYYPYKVAQLYGEFSDLFFDGWTRDEQLYFTRACRAVLSAIAAAPENQKRNRSIQECADVMGGFLKLL